MFNVGSFANVAMATNERNWINFGARHKRWHQQMLQTHSANLPKIIFVFISHRKWMNGANDGDFVVYHPDDSVMIIMNLMHRAHKGPANGIEWNSYYHHRNDQVRLHANDGCYDKMSTAINKWISAVYSRPDRLKANVAKIGIFRGGEDGRDFCFICTDDARRSSSFFLPLQLVCPVSSDQLDLLFIPHLMN